MDQKEEKKVFVDMFKSPSKRIDLYRINSITNVRQNFPD